MPTQGLLNLARWSASLMLASAVTLMATQVVLRFVFGSPQAWAEEVDRYLFVWSVYLGSIVALVRETHIRVTFLVDLGGAKAAAFSRGLARLANLVSFVYISYHGYVLAYANRAAPFYTIEFLPQVVFYLSVPMCMTAMAAYVLWPRGTPPAASSPLP